MTVIKPGWWRPIVMIPMGFVLCLSIALAVSKFAVDQPGQAVVALMIPVVICLIMGFRTRSVRLEISESVVRAKQGHWRGHPDKQALRSEITSIHYFPRIISFRGLDNKPIMMIDPNYTVRQMVRVASVLGVRMYDHTRWLGMRKTVNTGRLVYQLESGTVAKTPE